MQLKFNNSSISKLFFIQLLLYFIFIKNYYRLLCYSCRIDKAFIYKVDEEQITKIYSFKVIRNTCLFHPCGIISSKYF